MPACVVVLLDQICEQRTSHRSAQLLRGDGTCEPSSRLRPGFRVAVVGESRARSSGSSPATFPFLLTRQYFLQD